MSDSIYRRLEVWKESMQLAIDTYKVTQTFPKHELYGLTSQLRRAAVSVPSNIAEGRGRETKRDFCRFVVQARGSLYEVQTQISIADALHYATRDDLARLTKRSEVVVRLLNGLIRHLTDGVDSSPTPHPLPPTPKSP
ncbi:MAG TPA: four helix bundle protein [Thermoanaerobaculia bacterium]|jgi:four helix bundle protein|nr:four helix bundle protein [Thermoanaerobaculia bacterium]